MSSSSEQQQMVVRIEVPTTQALETILKLGISVNLSVDGEKVSGLRHTAVCSKNNEIGTMREHIVSIPFVPELS